MAKKKINTDSVVKTAAVINNSQRAKNWLIVDNDVTSGNLVLGHLLSPKAGALWGYAFIALTGAVELRNNNSLQAV